MLKIIISSIKNKSEKLKKYIDGEPSFIIYKGKLIQKSLLENRISINELLSELRLQGIGDIKDVYYAVLEQNGRISIIKRDEGEMRHNLVIDGEYMTDEIRLSGTTKGEIDKELLKKGVKADEVMLMTKKGDSFGIVKKKDENR